MIKFEWEEIWCSEDSSNTSLENVFIDTFRTKVFGGWIVRERTLIADQKRELEGWKDGKCSTVFIPDAKHEWVIEYPEV